MKCPTCGKEMTPVYWGITHDGVTHPGALKGYVCKACGIEIEYENPELLEAK